MKKIFHIAVGVIILLLFCLNTLIMAVPVIILSLAKLIPIRSFQILMTKALVGIATFWMLINNYVSHALLPTRYYICGYKDFLPHHSYLLISNHQSWLDIVVLQQTFLTKIPFLTFFMKKQLIYVPIIGLACWGLDFPLMSRYSKQYLQKYPHKKGHDLLKTKKACEKFQARNISVINFIEGTRFTKQKHQAQQSPYKHLLKPKAGGMAMMLHALKDELMGVLDITICYPYSQANFWHFLCGRVPVVEIHVDFIPLKDIPYGDYYKDTQAQKVFQNWINEHWRSKDQWLDQHLSKNDSQAV
ncbi:acyltransferase [Facilibium subflavum]|uniref:acyltransferase n=1 Tax=Facilibium subflavum TaxID=2219058 RepID=UPI000E65B071|nr:acyltransferase [Facilibium subflavum]